MVSSSVMSKNISFKNQQAAHLENVENEKGFVTPSSSSQNEAPFTIDPKVSARLRHAIDWRLIPALGAMYGISLMDRKNVSNAAIAGMLVDLKMGRGMGYNLVNLCFFITYVLCQPFMVVLCRKVGPRFFLPGKYHVMYQRCLLKFDRYMSGLGSCRRRLWLHEELAKFNTSTTRPGASRIGIFPGMCVFT